MAPAKHPLSVETRTRTSFVLFVPTDHPKTIHEITLSSRVLFVRFRVISWIVLSKREQNTKPIQDTTNLDLTTNILPSRVLSPRFSIPSLLCGRQVPPNPTRSSPNANQDLFSFLRFMRVRADRMQQDRHD